MDAPASGTRIQLRPGGPVYELSAPTSVVIGAVTAHEAVLLDAWDGGARPGPLHALSLRNGYLLASGSASAGHSAFTGGPSLEDRLLAAEEGLDRFAGQFKHEVPELPEALLWGRELVEGSSFELAERHRNQLRISAGVVEVGTITAGVLPVTIRLGDVGDTRYVAHLEFLVEGGRVPAFATTRTVTDRGTTWTGAVDVLSSGSGAPLPFRGENEDDAWPYVDGRYDRGLDGTTPYDPDPHPIFDVAGIVQVMLLYPNADILAFVQAAPLAVTAGARMSVLSTYPAAASLPAGVVGVWELTLCNENDDRLYIGAHGVKPAYGPLVPVRVSASYQPGAGCDVREEPRVALGQILAATERVTEPLWQPIRYDYDAGSARALLIEYDHVRTDHWMTVELDLGEGVVTDTFTPRLPKDL